MLYVDDMYKKEITNKIIYSTERSITLTDLSAKLSGKMTYNTFTSATEYDTMNSETYGYLIYATGLAVECTSKFVLFKEIGNGLYKLVLKK